MTNKIVKVVQIEIIKGNKADRIVLHYVGTDNTAWKIGALAAKLDASSRDALLGAKKDDLLDVEIIKEGNYWNLVKAAALNGEAAAKKSYQPSGTAAPFVKSKETDTRIQVMNALTNSIVSLGAGKTTKEYKERVIEFVTIGNDIVAAILANNLPINTQTTTAASSNEEIAPELGF